MGTKNLIKAGGLHWTAAGKGIVHEEVPEQTGKVVYMLQIFVNLSIEKQAAAPFVLSLETDHVPIIALNGVTIRVLLGCYGDVCSPLNPPTKVTLLDVSIEQDGEVSVYVPLGETVFFMLISGTVEIDGQEFLGGALALPVYMATNTSHKVTLRSVNGSAHVVAFSGAPLRQPVLSKESLALAAPEILSDRVAAYSRGEFGSL